MPAIPEERIRALTDKYLANNLTEAERQELDHLGTLYPGIWKLIDRLQDDEQLIKDLKQRHAIDTGKARAKLWALLDAEEKREMPRLSGTVRKCMLAAAVLLLLSAGIYLFSKERSDKPTSRVNPVRMITPYIQTDADPGSNKATLKLADGRQMRLDSIPTGNTIDLKGAAARKENSADLVYISSPQPLREDRAQQSLIRYPVAQYDTLITPRAGQFTVRLPDGTKVWLNNVTSLRYPTVFSDTSREVDLITGEAYFEVSKDRSRPFRVKVNGLIVDVLGTHFNIMDYDSGKNIKTTLLAGKVQVSDGVNKKILKPGEELSIKEDKKWQVQQGVDTAEVIAWKTGYFEFSQAGLSTVMQQLARWYDVEVEIEGGSTKLINATIDRNLPLSKILEHLNLTYKLEGKKLTIQR